MFGKIEVADVNEFKKDFDKYIEIMEDGNTFLVTKGGRQIGRFVPYSVGTPITDSLTGILKGNYDLEQVKDEYFKKKYEIVD